MSITSEVFAMLILMIIFVIPPCLFVMIIIYFLNKKSPDKKTRRTSALDSAHLDELVSESKINPSDPSYAEMTDPQYVKRLLHSAYGNGLDAAETEVARALNGLRLTTYVLFNNVVLASHGGNTPHTQIDHIVVSTNGIFCIETKGHKGAIYGSSSSKRKEWFQYLRSGTESTKYTFYNPFLQNYRHIQAIKELIGSDLRAPIHSYVIFPNAYKVQTDTPNASNDIYDIVVRIERHRSPVYDLQTYHRVLKTLAYASSSRDALASLHTKEVSRHLNQ